MRDLQHWKDKVELTLDGRQVFFLFFGGAVLACLLFAVGVMTGRRLEARAIALDTPGTDDPLVALDQLGDLDDEDLTYHRALTHPRELERAHAAPVKPIAPKPAAGRAAMPVAPVVPHALVPSHAETAVDAPPAARALALAPIAPEPVAPSAPPPKIAAPSAKLTSAPAKASVAAPTKADGKDSVVADSSAPRFTLQLSAFSARKDAEDFMRRVQSAGYHAFVVSSDVPGKGVVYRVRVGDYTSRDAALADKGGVEKKLKVAAYLAKI